MDLPRVGDEAERSRLRRLARAGPGASVVVGAGGRGVRQRRLGEEDLGRRRGRRLVMVVGGGEGTPVAGAGERRRPGGHRVSAVGVGSCALHPVGSLRTSRQECRSIDAIDYMGRI